MIPTAWNGKSGRLRRGGQQKGAHAVDRARRGRIVAYAAAGMIGLAMMPLIDVAQSQNRIPPRAVHVITVDQAITHATQSYITKAIERAAANDAECLIIQLDTPGGLLEATRDIVQALLNTHVPVVVYISPSGARGASAGTMITMAAHIAAMAPATHLGAAHPVSLFGMGGDNEVMADKVVNDTSAFIQGIAELRGRNAEWAISAVRESKSITADRALELNVIDLISPNLTQLVKDIDGREVRIDENRSVRLETAGRPLIHQDMNFRQSFMSMLSNPNLVYFLLILGLVGLYIEMSNPGLILPGVLGGISLIVALIAMQTLPISYGAFGLVILGIALLVAESFIPSFGLLGFGGIASLLIGSLFLLDESVTDLRVSPPLIFGAVATIGGIALIIGRLLIRSFRMDPKSFQSNIVGHVAEVRVAISPEQPGKVFLNGELWIAKSAHDLPSGRRVLIESAEGLELNVVPVPEASVAEAAVPEA
ncbi:MAG: nodulation protein NfeD [SAR324 cluster bacterium]|nr:nodulation protein NfeD [SAR324 cluster bacterium]